MQGNDGHRRELSEMLVEEFEAVKRGDPDLGGLGETAMIAGVRAAAAAAEASQEARERDIEHARRRAIYARAHEFELTALSLSGGGIRSASFSLGVIQGLAEHNLLKDLNYLSTVSGGGYIGSWLSAWLHWSEDADDVIRQLKAPRAAPDVEPKPLNHLRQYSSYLTPKTGLLSGDLWGAVAIIVRNLLLNWLVLLPVIVLPIVAVKLIAALTHTSRFAGVSAVLVGGACLFLGGLSFRYKLRRLYLKRELVVAAHEESFILWGSLAPAIVAGLCYAWIAGMSPIPPDLIGWLLMALVAVLVLTVVLISLDEGSRGGSLDQACWFVGAVVWGTMIWLGMSLYRTIGSDGGIVPIGTMCVKTTVDCVAKTAPVIIGLDRQLVLVILGLPWFLLSILLAQTVYTACRSYSKTGDFEREWLGRIGGWYLLAGLGWIALSGVVLLGPYLFYNADLIIDNGQAWLTAVGALSGGVTAFLGKSSLTSGSGDSKTWAGLGSNIALAIAGPLFAVILLILLSVVFDKVALDDQFAKSAFFTGAPGNPFYASDWAWTLIVTGGLGAGWFFSDLMVNVNRFSLHALYRNRLIRAYLGGPREGRRRPDGFTDFDQADNIRLTEIWHDRPPSGPDWRPYHVINIALNLASTKDLAWQQRMAMSFVATPRHCGAAELGYRATGVYGDPAGGISLGTALAVSGAAVSSNMGYHSSPSLAFLLTLLNVRLGWWLGNPGKFGDARESRQHSVKQAINWIRQKLNLDPWELAPYRQDAPWLSIKPLMAELFGMTNEESSYVYLSDGGHFEDLALYEMVRRRCRWIIVCDGAQDGEHAFEDLGNAVRKIRIDLGVRISFPDSSLLRADKDAKPADVPYYAIGTIDYPSDRTPAGGPAPRGRVLYIKPGVRGSEAAADVIAYQRANPEFPQQTTGDQWFDEPQLEAYRALGYLMFDRIVAAATRNGGTPATLAALFAQLDGIDPKTLARPAPPEST